MRPLRCAGFYSEYGLEIVEGAVYYKLNKNLSTVLSSTNIRFGIDVIAISGTRYSNVVNDRIARDYLKGVLYLYLGAFDVAKNSFLLATQGTSNALSKGVILYFLSIASRMMGDTFGAEQYEKEFLNYLRKI